MGHVLAGGQTSRGPVAVLDREPGGDEPGPEGRPHARADGHVMQHDQAEEHPEQQPDADAGAPATEVVRVIVASRGTS